MHFGLVMVLSSSSVESYVAGGSFFTDFAKQGAFAAIGVVVMLIAARMPEGPPYFPAGQVSDQIERDRRDRHFALRRP